MRCVVAAWLAAMATVGSGAHAAEGLSGFYPFVPATPAPVTITPDTVDLDNAGTFVWDFDEDRYPVTLAEGTDQAGFGVRLWFDPAGKPLACDTGAAAMRDLAARACADLVQSASFRLAPGFALPFRKGFIDVAFAFYLDKSGKPWVHGTASHAPGYVNTRIIYPEPAIAPERMLTKADGAPDLRGIADLFDYPGMTIVYQANSLSRVLVGYDRGGRARECRPVTAAAAPNTASLDNLTCVLLAQRGRYVFAPDAPRYDGVKYTVQSVHWVVPQ